MSTIYLDIPPDTDSEDTEVEVSIGQRADVPAGDDGTSAATWVLIALVAVIIAAAIVALVLRRNRRA